MSYFVYVLRSKEFKNRYIGCTADICNRLNEHNQGRCRYTSGRRPWQLIYKEEYGTLPEARKREKFLKTGKGREELDLLLK